TARDAADARARHVLEPVRRTLDNALCRAQSAADRRSNALTQIAGREPRGVPGDEGVVAAYHVHAPAQVVAVAARIVVGARREPAAQARGAGRAVRGGWGRRGGGAERARRRGAKAGGGMEWCTRGTGTCSLPKCTGKGEKVGRRGGGDRRPIGGAHG